MTDSQRTDGDSRSKGKCSSDVWNGWLQSLYCVYLEYFELSCWELALLVCVSLTEDLILPQQKSTAKPHLPTRLRTRMSWLWKRVTSSTSWARYSFATVPLSQSLWNKESISHSEVSHILVRGLLFLAFSQFYSCSSFPLHRLQQWGIL